MGWQPIETAPKDDKAVIVSSSRNGKLIGVRLCVWNGLGWYEVYSGAGINYVTHWMPLPELPTTLIDPIEVKFSEADMKAEKAVKEFYGETT